jgi:hypothetical protein
MISYARVFAGLKLITPEADIFQNAKVLQIILKKGTIGIY